MENKSRKVKVYPISGSRGQGWVGESMKAPSVLERGGATGGQPEAGGPGSGGTRVGPLRSVFVRGGGFTSVFGRD